MKNYLSEDQENEFKEEINRLHKEIRKRLNDLTAKFGLNDAELSTLLGIPYNVMRRSIDVNNTSKFDAGILAYIKRKAEKGDYGKYSKDINESTLNWLIGYKDENAYFNFVSDGIEAINKKASDIEKEAISKIEISVGKFPIHFWNDDYIEYKARISNAEMYLDEKENEPKNKFIESVKERINIFWKRFNEKHELRYKAGISHPILTEFLSSSDAQFGIEQKKKMLDHVLQIINKYPLRIDYNFINHPIPFSVEIVDDEHTFMTAIFTQKDFLGDELFLKEIGSIAKGYFIDCTSTEMKNFFESLYNISIKSSKKEEVTTTITRLKTLIK